MNTYSFIALDYSWKYEILLIYLFCEGLFFISSICFSDNWTKA